jgi:hypothetical protein
LKHSHRYGRN